MGNLTNFLNEIANKYVDYWSENEITNPKVSVIVPAYNVEKYIEDCLASLVKQTFKDFEVIVINDGSTDLTPEIANVFQHCDKRFRLISQKNQGLSCARNTGLSVANGEYISFVDSDDWLDANFIEKLYNSITHNDCDIAISSILRKRPRMQKYRVYYNEEKVYETLQEKLDICNIPKCCYVWNKLYRADLIKNSFFQVGKYFEDVLWIPEVIKASKKLVTVPNTNYYCRVTKYSIVKKNSPQKQNDSYLSKKYIVKFFDENNLDLPKKNRIITKEIKYFFGIPVLKIKEQENVEIGLLFGFIKIFERQKSLEKDLFKNFCPNVKIFQNSMSKFINKMNVLLKQLFSISTFDGHKVVYLCGFHIRSKIKRNPILNIVSEYGLNTEHRDVRVVASLTTFPERITTVKETIKTLLLQTCKPDELVLWLATEQFPDGEKSLPKDLLDLKQFGLTIKWCNDIKSYKKLIPALKEYPDDIIITFDDDIYYDKNVIELLYNSYLKYPDCISANRGNRLELLGDKIKVLKTAKLYWIRYKDSTFRNTITGCGGVLYPPHCLSEEATNESKFMSIMPTQDDVWFWAMAVLNKTPVRMVASYDINLLTVDNTQQYGLCKINNKKSGKGMHANDGFAVIAEKYPQIIENMKKEEINV